MAWISLSKSLGGITDSRRWKKKNKLERVSTIFKQWHTENWSRHINLVKNSIKTILHKKNPNF